MENHKAMGLGDMIACATATENNLNTYIHNLELSSSLKNIHVNHEREFRKTFRPSTPAKMIATHQISHLSTKYQPNHYTTPSSILYHTPYLPSRLDVTNGNHILHRDYHKLVLTIPMTVKKSLKNIIKTFNVQDFIYCSSCLCPTFHFDLINSLSSGLQDHRILVDKQFDESIKQLFADSVNFHANKNGVLIYPTLDRNFGPFYILKLKIKPG